MYTCLQLQSYIFIGQSYKARFIFKSSITIDHNLPGHRNLQSELTMELLGKSMM